jgi:hypothetical protein
MTTRIILPDNPTSGSVPLPSAIQQAELVINTADGRLFTKNESGQIILLNSRTVSGDGIVSSSLQLSGSVLTGNLIQSATFANYNERVVSASISAATLSLDLSQGNVFEVLVSQSMLVTFTNAASATLADTVTLVARYDGTRTLTWAPSIRWPGGTAPTVSTTSGSVDIFTFVTINGGDHFYGVFSGKGY